ncbi:MAG: dTDP-4-dehydrorhamnose reductase [Methanosarcinales archaeon]|nr:dTDP-4-dehydrorhamnose reductase [Methanosarcinales archaeon]
MRVLVLGSGGQLGSELCRVMEEHDLIPTKHSEVDVSRLPSLVEFSKQVRPEVVINATGYTDVDGCEANRERAFLVNAIGARNPAIAAREAGAELIHISTDYVFDGRKEEPYVECDMAMPLSNYGWSKLMGERMAMEQNPRTFILRIAWLYSLAGRNFVKTILALARDRDELCIVNDQRGTPTFAGDVAMQIKLLMGTESYGLYHCTSQGSCTWCDFAREILRLAKIPVRVKPVTSAEYPRPARRPAYSVLDNLMLRVQGLDIMPPWQDSLAMHIGEIKELVE